jgi:hypothetical protein
MVDLLEPQKKLIAGLSGQTKPPKQSPTPTPAATPKAPTGPDYVPLAVQPDEHSEYMGKQLSKISSKINTQGQELTKNRLLKNSPKASGKR